MRTNDTTRHSPAESPIDRLLARLADARETAAGWSARCPAHDDGRASLSISIGDDGRALVHCHAGCTIDAVCAAVGVRLTDLMPANGDGVPTRPRKPIPATSGVKSVGKTYTTADGAIAELERRHGPRSAHWTYHDAHGEPVGVVIRWNLPTGKKDIRPVSRQGDVWRIGGMPKPRPLYGLPRLAGAKRIYVCEGEKAADAARSIGLTATTSAHGCESPGKTDWQPLADKEVVILPDNDAPGRKYSDTVVALLSKLTPAPLVKLVDLPDLPEHGDTADFIAAHAGTEPDALRQIVEALADAALEWTPDAEAQPVNDEGAAPNGGGGKPRQSQTDKLVELAHASGIELFRTPGGDPEAYATISVGEHRETMRVHSRAFRMFLARQLWQAQAKAPAAQSLQDALGVLSGQALWEGDVHSVAVRLAEHDNGIYLDLANPDWQVVQITADGWQIMRNPPVRFVRPRGVLPLPVPEHGGSLDDLRPFVNVASDDDFLLLTACMVAYMRPSRPFPVLALYGEQGSAKSTTTRIVRDALDPNAAALRAEPREPRDLIIAAQNGWIVALENLSRIPEWLSDALCRLATGGGFSTRELYTDGEEKLFDAMRPVVLNGIVEVVTRPDLADRTVAITLPTIAEEKRRTEADFWPRYQSARPRILGALLAAASTALHRIPDTRLQRLPRMADFAVWATAALGSGFIDAYDGNRAGLNETALESSTVANYVVILAEQHPSGWQGTAADLLGALDALATDNVRSRRDWPTKANVLAGSLRRIAPNLRQTGVQVEFNRTGRSRTVTIRMVAKDIVTTVTDRDPPGKTGACTGTRDCHQVVTNGAGDRHQNVVAHRLSSPLAAINAGKMGGSDDGAGDDDEFPSLSIHRVLASELQHRDLACRSLEFWEHIHAGYFCAHCWPCRDVRAKAGEGIAI